MPNPNYRTGDEREKRVCDYLRRDGYFCGQARGSKGVVDIFACKPRQTLFLQVKGGAKTISSSEWNLLHEIAALYGALPILADFPEARRGPGGGSIVGELRMRHITGRATPSTPSDRWPSRPFITDVIAAAL